MRTRWPRPSPIEWLLLVIGLVLVVRYRWMMDDAYVYFRYVDNLLFVGVGLVFNAGEYVEGYSSPLHVLVLSALRALELGWPAIVLGLGCVSFVAFWALLVVLNRALAPRDVPALNLPLAYLVTNYGLTSFFTSGLETPLAHVMAPAVALFLLRPRSRVLALTVALAPLVRPELAVAVAGAGAFAWWRQRSFPWWLAGAALTANGAWLLFRIVYYADLLPNTFYLKDTTRFDQGWRYLAGTANTYHLLGFALLVAGLAWLARRRPRHSGSAPDFDLHGGERLVMLAIAGTVALYIARVGGTHCHYWYLAFAFSLAVCASGGIVEAAMRGLDGRRWRVLGPASMLAVSLAVLACIPPQLSTHPLSDDVQHHQYGLVDAPLVHTLMLRELHLDPFGPGGSPEALRKVGERIPARGPRRTLVGGMCIQQYVRIEDRWVHGFGLTDAVLARVDAGWVKPGHNLVLPMAEDLARIQRNAPWIGRGMFRRAVAQGIAPKWVAGNLDSIETIERKIYNIHDLRQNLSLALTFPPRIARKQWRRTRVLEPGRTRVPQQLPGARE